jgi:hypothetical protein
VLRALDGAHPTTKASEVYLRNARAALHDREVDSVRSIRDVLEAKAAAAEANKAAFDARVAELNARETPPSPGSV